MSYSPMLDLVLLGESGSGKSASGNTILGQTAFASRASAAPVTTECQVAVKTICGTQVTVIDTPDLSDEDLQNPEEHVEKCRSLCQGDLCVYLLVIQIGRFTEGERDLLERLEKEMGSIRDRTIILFTHGDDLDQHIDDYVRNTNPHLQRLVRECGNRYHVFKNRERNEEQVEGMMNKITALLKETDKIDVFTHKKRKKDRKIIWYFVGGAIVVLVIICIIVIVTLTI